MPIYEYRCDACGHYLDALQKIADAPLRDCPSCEESALCRLVSAPNFRLKGKGWYETDFKSDKETKRNLVDRPDDASAGKDKEPTKSDGASGKGASGKRDSASGKSGAEKSKQASSTSGGRAGSKSASRSGRRSGSAAA